ncbi:two-component sensor histidine kinase [Clostridium sp. 19966]|uniref:sensor histidine kinase n=1 Tax=Clostridium sp. 19966 TaxID=2768166 RepID=UPI0028DE1890|nr:histidine kinase [Clostridium sp. 19966]MDT8717213.1 two-component sensor histidine kinase [Clostridium sp. 19966]
MENYIIITKIAVLIYCITDFITNDSMHSGFVKTHVPFTVGFFLAYVCLTVLVCIADKRKAKEFIHLVTIVGVWAGFKYLDNIFILLMPLSICELVFMITDNAWIPAIMIEMPLFTIQENMISKYILVSALTCTIYIAIYRYHYKLKKLYKENDIMRNTIHNLSGKLIKDSEYERQVKYTSQLEERNKIAQDIHDRIGHSMSGSMIQLEAAKIYLHKDPEKAQEIVQRVINILREGTENIRATLKNIKPQAQQIGINRIKLLLDEFNVNHNIKAQMVFSGDLQKINSINWKVISDNIKEALTNIIKYSYATEVKVNIQVLNGVVKSEIRDNGIGAHYIKKGLGITGMEERSASAGGKVIVDGSNGFSIITLLPIEE